MMKLRTKITLLVCSVVAAILLLNQYPVSMSMRQTVMQANGSALLDVVSQLARSPLLAQAGDSALTADARRIVRQTEECASCSGLAILDRAGQVRYNSPDGIDPQTAAEYHRASPREPRYDIRSGAGSDTIYAVCPIYGADGETLGQVVGKLRFEQDQPGLQKAQRDLNAMTVLVMLIALIFVWDLTDNIKGTMFNLEPVEIAQLLVERNALIDAVRDGILSVDREGRILHANRTALGLFQRCAGHFDPQAGRFSDIFPHVPFRELLQGDQPVYDNECLIGSDSFYANFIPIKIEKPRHESLLVTFRPKQEVVRFAEDITGVKSYVEALRAQMHEFNNKLQVVSGLVQEKKYPELEGYVHDLIHLKKREMDQVGGKVRDPILAAFLLGKFDRAAEQKVDLVLTDRSQLQSPLPRDLVQDLVVVVGNLLENAFDAVQGCAMRTVTLELVETAGEIRVSVWDSGVSIPEPLLERLFDYGVTTKEEGHGIGLFLVRQSCSRYNGYVSVASDPRDGTEFTAHIPFLKEQEGAHVPGTDR